MKRLALFLLIIATFCSASLVYADSGAAQALAELSWTDRGFQFGRQLVSQVQQEWQKVKTWMGNNNPQPNSAPSIATAPGSQQAPAAALTGAPAPAPTPSIAPIVATTGAPAAPVGAIASPSATTAADLQKTRATVQNQKGFSVVDPGHKAQANLPRDKAGVARTNALGGKSKSGKTVAMPARIPRLDVGQESRLSADKFQLDRVRIAPVPIVQQEKLKSPEVISAEVTHQTLQKVVGPQGVTAAGSPQKLRETQMIQNRILSLAKVRGMKFKISDVVAVQERPYKALPMNEMRYLTILLLIDHGDQCHVVAGLLYQMRNEKSVQGEVNYHLANCAQKMGLHDMYLNSLMRVIASEDKIYLPKALTEMNAEFTYDTETKIGQALQKIQSKALIPADARSKVNYLIAKADLRLASFQTALIAAQGVGSDFAKYPEAQYILATAQYATGDAKGAIATQEHLLDYLENKSGSAELKVLVQMNLGRIAFQDKQFDKARDYFLKIDKNHPLWIEALIEQGWAQLQSGDLSGAIGNMYSIHSPFFRNVYIPESYVIRTIGYLNLCQYGDAYKSLSMLEHNYRPWLNAMNKYANNVKDHGGYYETVRKYLKASSTADVDGLPYQVIREIARQRDFINHQQALNNAEDEVAQYKFLENMLIKDKTVVAQKLAQLKTKEVETRRGLTGSIARHESGDIRSRYVYALKKIKSQIDFYAFRLDVQLDARKAFAEMSAESSKSIVESRTQMHDKLNQILGRHFARIRKNLNQIMENNELLRYEVFSGSGENLRFQTAGGQVGGGGRVPASAKPTSKNLRWDFDGEYWADEIGNYRSTLANNCPENHASRATTPTVAGGE